MKAKNLGPAISDLPHTPLNQSRRLFGVLTPDGIERSVWTCACGCDAKLVERDSFVRLNAVGPRIFAAGHAPDELKLREAPHWDEEKERPDFGALKAEEATRSDGRGLMEEAVARAATVRDTAKNVTISHIEVPRMDPDAFVRGLHDMGRKMNDTRQLGFEFEPPTFPFGSRLAKPLFNVGAVLDEMRKSLPAGVDMRSEKLQVSYDGGVHWTDATNMDNRAATHFRLVADMMLPPVAEHTISLVVEDDEDFKLDENGDFAFVDVDGQWIGREA